MNQFDWFVQFPAARAESSEAVLTQSCNKKFKNIKSVEDVALDLQSIESKYANAIVYEDLYQMNTAYAVYGYTGIDRLHSITVHDTTMTLPDCCTST